MPAAGIGGTDPCLRDAESGDMGGLGSEGRNRGVEPTRGSGGSPRLLSGNFGGNRGGSAGGGRSPGSGRTVGSMFGTFPYG